MTQGDSEATGSVELPEPLLDRVERRVAATEFGSADDYVAEVLGEVLLHVEETSEDPGERIDDEDVKHRLKSLGYASE